MIVVEGCDGSGKTTLLNRLTEYFDYPIAPRVVSKDTEALVNLMLWVQENLAKGWQETFYDRHRLISEPIYGPVLRPKAEPGFSNAKWMYAQFEKFYREVKPVIIYCLPPLEVVKENLEGDDDNKVVVNHTEQIYSAYVAQATRDVMWRPSLHFGYDYTQPNAETMLSQIILTIADQQRIRG